MHSGEANLLSAAERVNHWRIIDHCLTVILETPSTDRTILDVKAPVDWCFTMFDVPPFLMIRAPCQSCFMDKFEPTIVTFHFFLFMVKASMYSSLSSSFLQVAGLRLENIAGRRSWDVPSPSSSAEQSSYHGMNHWFSSSEKLIKFWYIYIYGI